MVLACQMSQTSSESKYHVTVNKLPDKHPKYLSNSHLNSSSKFMTCRSPNLTAKQHCEYHDFKKRIFETLENRVSNLCAEISSNLENMCNQYRQENHVCGKGETKMTKKLLILILVVLGASLIGNFLLYQQNTQLVTLLDQITEDNRDTTTELSEYGSGSDTQIIPQEKQSESDIGFPDDDQPIAVGDHIIPSEDGNRSITAVAVRPLVMRDMFFERTQYEGAIMEITVSVREQGEGLVLLDTKVPTGISFQESARTAADVAEKYFDADLSDKDVVFSITVDTDDEDLQTVDGHSAGAAMAVLLVSELEGLPIRNNVVITGSVLPDASIGAVGGISEKAEAAGKHGAQIFLVPVGQNIAAVESCEESRTGNFVYRSCTLEEKQLSSITKEAFGMNVIEVAGIKDALQYFHTNTS